MSGQTGIKMHTHSLADYDVNIGDITVSAEVKMATAKNSSSGGDNNTLHVGNKNEDTKGVTALTADSIDI